MDLFEVRNNIAVPSTHALLIEPFKSIWDRDKSKHKELAIKELTYIELSCSMKKTNPFSGYADDVRASKVIEAIFKEEEFDPDPLVLEAIEKYKQMVEESSPSMRLLRAAENGTEKLISFLNTVDLSERTGSGAAVIKPAEVSRTLKESHDVVLALKKLRELVQQEVTDSSKTRGDRDINPFER